MQFLHLVNTKQYYLEIIIFGFIGLELGVLFSLCSETAYVNPQISHINI